MRDTAQLETAPRCVHFGTCGGCQYQNVAYAEQLRIKRSHLLQLLDRSQVEAPHQVAMHSAEPWAYRNRVQFNLGNDPEPTIGYILPSSRQREHLPIVECPILAPVLWAAGSALVEHVKRDDAAKLLWSKSTDVEFFCNDDQSRVQMMLYVTSVGRKWKGHFAHLCEALQRSFPQLSGAGLVRNVNSSRARAAWTAVESWGTTGLNYRVPVALGVAETYWIARGGFFQVNRFLLPALVELVTAGRSGTLAWDLFSGVGLFSRVLARSFAQVVAVETDSSAVTDLAAAFRRIGAQHKAVAAATLDFLRSAVLQRDRPELVVLDPPRAGAGAEACELLNRIAPREIVYVSCDPDTLARDLAVLQRQYSIVALHLVDLFPQTSHLETVVYLQCRS